MKLANYASDYKGKAYYEWDIETWEDGEVLDHNHFDEFPGIPEDENQRLVLVKDIGVIPPGDTEPNDLYSRTWAYIEDGKLPEFFEDGTKVPAKFHKEMVV